MHEQRLCISNATDQKEEGMVCRKAIMCVGRDVAAQSPLKWINW
jgi:hypothetical protein